MHKLLYILPFLAGPLLRIDIQEPQQSTYQNQLFFDQESIKNQLLGNNESGLIQRLLPEDITLLADLEQAFTTAPYELQNFCKLIMLDPIPQHIIPEGFIMYGPPGTGKTELAKALVKKTGFAFYNLSGGQVGSKWINETANNIKKIFDQIHMELELLDDIPGAILFIDEIEALAPSRSNLRTHQEDTKAVTVLLQEIQGMFSHKKPIVVIGATNVIQNIDSALISRLKKISISLPNKQERLLALKHLIPQFFKNIEPMPETWIEHIAQHSNGLSYRDLVGIAKEAATCRYLNQSLDISTIDTLIQKRFQNKK